MTASEVFKERHEAIKTKLLSVELPKDISSTQICWTIGNELKVSGTTVKNYISGDIKDGYLAEAIYKELKRLKRINN